MNYLSNWWLNLSHGLNQYSKFYGYIRVINNSQAFDMIKSEVNHLIVIYHFEND